MTFFLRILILMILPLAALAQDKLVNVYAWSGEIPDFIIKQFEKETGIKVNFSTYDNNEIMYTKIRASKNAGYDVIMPSSYYVDRMRDQHLLEKFDKSKLSNEKYLDASFTHTTYDPGNQYSMPFIWGITGIFVNDRYFKPDSVKKWSDFWDARFANQLMMLDDSREVFSMALLSMGYSVKNQSAPLLRAAYEKLQTLQSNIKVYSSETVVSILIDEDATVGMAWNGDAYKASQENPHVRFIFPEEGFIIWVDNFSIPVNAPHKDAAYTFINFMTRPEIAKASTLVTNFPTANLAAQKMLPPDIRNNPVIYPSKEVLKHGQFQMALPDPLLLLYEKYWEKLKMGG